MLKLGFMEAGCSSDGQSEISMCNSDANVRSAYKYYSRPCFLAACSCWIEEERRGGGVGGRKCRSLQGQVRLQSVHHHVWKYLHVDVD